MFYSENVAFPLFQKRAAGKSRKKLKNNFEFYSKTRVEITL